MAQDHDKPSSSNDIRGQLSDIQNRLFNSSSKDRSPKKKLPTSHSVPLLLLADKTTSSPKKADKSLVSSQPAPSLGPESKGNDMNYVVGLSQNLVSECRRLNAENQKLKTKLKSNTDEMETFKEQIVSLQSRRDIQVTNETDLKDRNWELESNVLSLKEKVNELSSAREKLLKSTKDQDQKITTFQNSMTIYSLNIPIITTPMRRQRLIITEN